MTRVGAMLAQQPRESASIVEPEKYLAVEGASGECETRKGSARKRSGHKVREHFLRILDAGSCRL